MVDMLKVRRIRGCGVGHDRLAGDDDALLQRCVTRYGDRIAVAVGTIARNVDDMARSAVGALLEQRHGEPDRARNRCARPAANRRCHDFSCDSLGRFRPVDLSPGNDDFLVLRG
jgi:hypothetical protein